MRPPRRDGFGPRPPSYGEMMRETDPAGQPPRPDVRSPTAPAGAVPVSPPRVPGWEGADRAGPRGPGASRGLSAEEQREEDGPGDQDRQRFAPEELEDRGGVGGGVEGWHRHGSTVHPSEGVPPRMLTRSPVPLHLVPGRSAFGGASWPPAGTLRSPSEGQPRFPVQLSWTRCRLIKSARALVEQFRANGGIVK